MCSSNLEYTLFIIHFRLLAAIFVLPFALTTLCICTSAVVLRDQINKGIAFGIPLPSCITAYVVIHTSGSWPPTLTHHLVLLYSLPNLTYHSPGPRNYISLPVLLDLNM